MPSGGGVFNALEMLWKLSAAYQGVEPAIERLQKRLGDLRCLILSIHELRPNNIVLGDLFEKASLHLTDELMSDFGHFLKEYSRVPKLFKRGFLNKYSSTLAKPKKFILSSINENRIRRFDEALTKVVAEINLLLQVEGIYNLNNMSDSIRAVLGKLEDIPHANAQIVRDMEFRVMGNLKSMRDQLDASNHMIKDINSNVSVMAKDLATIYKRLDAIPKYLQSIKSTEIRDLWRHREWPDCIPFGHFARALDDFIDYTFAGLGNTVQRRIVARLCSELTVRLIDHSHGGNQYLAPSDLDRLIPSEAQLIDYLLGAEFGWLLLIRHFTDRLDRLSLSLEVHPAKTRRLVANLNLAFEPFMATYPIDSHYIPDVVCNVERNPDDYRKLWPLSVIEILDSIDKINALLGTYMDKNIHSSLCWNIINDQSTVSQQGESSSVKEINDIAVFGHAHAVLFKCTPIVYAEFGTPQAKLHFDPSQLIFEADPADVAVDVDKNRNLSHQYLIIYRNLAKCITNTQYAPDSLPSPAELSRIFIKIADISQLKAIAIPKLCNTYSGIYQSIPVLVHPIGISCDQDLPSDLTEMIRNTRQPHPGILHILGLVVYENQWTLVNELPNSGLVHSGCISTLADYLSLHNNGLDMEFKFTAARTITSALDYLHNSGVTHRSLCPSSVLIDPKMNIKVISSFSSAKWISLNDQVQIDRYASPETLAGYVYPGPSRELADCWSLGATIVAVLTGKEFLSNVPCAQVKNVVQSGSFTVDVLPIKNGRLAERILHMIEPGKSPTNRTSVEDLSDLFDDILNEEVMPQIVSKSNETTVDRKSDTTAPAAHHPKRSMSYASISSDTPTEYSLPSYRQLFTNSPTSIPKSPSDTISQAIAIYEDETANLTDAIPMFQTAYNVHGIYDALHYLGDIYYFGRSKDNLAPNYFLAYQNYLKASQNGSQRGHVGLGDLYLFNLGLPDAPSKHIRLQQARHHYELAFRNNSQPSARLLCGISDLEYYAAQGESRFQYRVVELSCDAYARYQKANEIKPGYYRAQVGMADCLLAQKKVEDAKDMYLMVAEIMPSLRRVYIGLTLTSLDHEDRDSYGVMSEGPGVHDF